MTVSEYISWILSQENEGFTVEKTDEEHLTIENELCRGEINFYNLGIDVVEMTAFRKEDDENIFFLHFELKDDEHAYELYREMTETLQKQSSVHTTRVLLSCTSGMTTSFFATKLNEGAKMLSLDYEFAAVPYAQLYQEGFAYDVILLAPQIAYHFKQAEEVFHDKLVLRIPAGAFGTYDTGTVLTMVKDAVETRQKKQKEKETASLAREVENNARLLVITLLHDVSSNRYGYRIYDKGNPVFSEEIIKERITIQDLEDILVTQLSYWRVDAVAISMPGMITEDTGSQWLYKYQYDEYEKRFSEKFGVDVFVFNNSNTVAYGYYATQLDYRSITYHSQPAGSLIGGQGMVIDGIPVVGAKGIAGEINFMFPMIKPKEITGTYSWMPHEIGDMIGRNLAMNIAVFNPDAIVLRSDLTPQMPLIRQEIEKWIDPEFIPDLIYVRDVSEYSYIGTMLMGLDRLSQKRDNKE